MDYPGTITFGTMTIQEIPMVPTETKTETEKSHSEKNNTPQRLRLKFNPERKTYEFIGDDFISDNFSCVEIETCKGVYVLRTMPFQNKYQNMIPMECDDSVLDGILWGNIFGVYNPIRNCVEMCGNTYNQFHAIECDMMNWVLQQPPQKDQLQMTHEVERESVLQTFQELSKT